MNEQPSKLLRNAAISMILIVGLYALGWNWIQPFLSGERLGIYWLGIFFPGITILLPAALMIETFILACVLIQRKRHGLPSLPKLNSILILSSFFGVIGLSFSLLVSTSVDLRTFDQAATNEHQYYLARMMSLHGQDYFLFECDAIGIVCKQIWSNGRLSYPDIQGQPKLSIEQQPTRLVLENYQHVLYTQNLR